MTNVEAGDESATPSAELCVSLQPREASIARGKTAEWTVTTWAENANVTNATVTLASAGQKPTFTFGCSKGEGTATCALGTVDPTASPRQMIASVPVPATATTLTSLKLTATGDAPGMTTKPAVAVAVKVTAPPASGSAGAGTGSAGAGPSAGAPGGVGSATSPLPIGALPSVGDSGLPVTSSLTPGGNASSLFPTVSPGAVPTPGGASGSSGTSARPVANSEALPIGTPVVDAQLAGLGALGVAFLLAMTRLSVRRRPAGVPAGSGASSAAAHSATPLDPTAAPKPPADPSGQS